MHANPMFIAQSQCMQMDSWFTLARASMNCAAHASVPSIDCSYFTAAFTHVNACKSNVHRPVSMHANGLLAHLGESVDELRRTRKCSLHRLLVFHRRFHPCKCMQIQCSSPSLNACKWTLGSPWRERR